MTRNRWIALIVALVVLIALVAVGVSACGTKMVRVETGTRVMCTYGEVVSDSVKVIEVPADKASQYRVVTTTITCDRHKHLEELYAEAQAAIAAGKTADAQAKLAEIAKSDPLFKNAQAQADAIKAGKTPPAASANATSSPSPPSGPSGQQPVGPVANLSQWVPATLTGYTAAPIVADVYTLTREYTPSSSGTPADSLVIVVEQYKDAKSAQTAIKNSIARDYPATPSTTQISGRSVRFGTDEHRFATVAWNEAGVLIVIEASSSSREPVTLKSHLIALASEIVK